MNWKILCDTKVNIYRKNANLNNPYMLKVAGYKFSIQKLIVFPHTGNKQLNEKTL